MSHESVMKKHWFRYNDFSLDQNHPLSKPVTNKVNTFKTIAQEIHCYNTGEFLIASIILSWVFFFNQYDESLIDAVPLSNLITSRWNAQTYRTMSSWWSQMSWPQIRTMLTQLWQQCYRNHNTQYTYHITGIKQTMFGEVGISETHWFLWIFNG